MRVVVQRVSQANVSIKGNICGKIQKGLVLLAGFHKDDTLETLKFVADKIVHLRIFSDENQNLNQNLQDIQGEILLISNFTVYGDCRKGRRPSFTEAMPPDKAKWMYEQFLEILQTYPLNIQNGEFQAMMQVSLVNDGPVTVIVEK